MTEEQLKKTLDMKFPRLVIEIGSKLRGAFFVLGSRRRFNAR